MLYSIARFSELWPRTMPRPSWPKAATSLPSTLSAWTQRFELGKRCWLWTPRIGCWPREPACSRLRRCYRSSAVWRYLPERQPSTDWAAFDPFLFPAQSRYASKPLHSFGYTLCHIVHLFLCVRPAHGDPQRAVALFRLQAQREKHVAGLQLVRGAGRSRGHGDSFGVEEEEQRFAFHIGKAEIQASGKSSLHGSIDPGILNPLQNQCDQPVPQLCQPLSFCGHALAAQLCCSGQAYYASHVLRSRAQASFVPAALHYALQFSAPANVERSHAFGPVELVSGKGERIDTQERLRLWESCPRSARHRYAGRCPSPRPACRSPPAAGWFQSRCWRA